jgi:phosphoribosylanthranilate isomerase
MRSKICGLSTSEQVKTCIEYGANFCGFILNYPKSHRYISYDKAVELTNIDKQKTKFVGVLVNPKSDELEIFSKLNLDYFQIYGDYNSAEIKDIKKKYKKKVIMVIQVKSKKDVLEYKKFEGIADIILWDSSGLEQSLGWNFDWIKSIPQNISKMLAGNININDVGYISELTDIVDVSGALETNKVKDINKIKNFLNKIKNTNVKNKKR